MDERLNSPYQQAHAWSGQLVVPGLASLMAELAYARMRVRQAIEESRALRARCREDREYVQASIRRLIIESRQLRPGYRDFHDS